jgi:hypothetical protein
MGMETTSTGTLLRSYIDRLKDKGMPFGPGCYLAGGAIRRAVCEHPIEEGDFDIYITNDWKFELAVREHGWNLLNKHFKKELNMTTYEFVIDKLKVQLHYMKAEPKPTLSAILKTFDFTCCQFAYDGTDVKYLVPALEDCRNLRLRYTGVAGQFTTSRAFRLMHMGFKPRKETYDQLQKLAAAPILAAKYPGSMGKS